MADPPFDDEGAVTIRAGLSSAERGEWEGAIRGHAGPLARHLLSDRRVQALAHSDTIRAWVDPILGTGARCVRALLFDKRPGSNWVVAWHQDTMIPVHSRPPDAIPGFGAWSVKHGVPHVRPPASVLESMVSVRLNLDPAQASNGALKVLPGSHRGGLLDAAAIESARERHQAKTLEVAAGDVVLMRPLLLHASSRSAAPTQRRVVHLEFAGTSLPEPLEWAPWTEEGA